MAYDWQFTGNNMRHNERRSSENIYEMTMMNRILPFNGFLSFFAMRCVSRDTDDSHAQWKTIDFPVAPYLLPFICSTFSFRMRFFRRFFIFARIVHSTSTSSDGRQSYFCWSINKSVYAIMITASVLQSNWIDWEWQTHNRFGSVWFGVDNLWPLRMILSNWFSWAGYILDVIWKHRVSPGFRGVLFCHQSNRCP